MVFYKGHLSMFKGSKPSLPFTVLKVNRRTLGTELIYDAAKWAKLNKYH